MGNVTVCSVAGLEMWDTIHVGSDGRGSGFLSNLKTSQFASWFKLSVLKKYLFGDQIYPPWKINDLQVMQNIAKDVKVVNKRSFGSFI